MEQNSIQEDITQQELSNYIKQLNHSRRTHARAADLLRQVEKLESSPRRILKSKIAAAIYIAGILEGERRTQKRISDVTGVSQSSIRTHYMDLARRLDLRQG